MDRISVEMSKKEHQDLVHTWEEHCQEDEGFELFCARVLKASIDYEDSKAESSPRRVEIARSDCRKSRGMDGTGNQYTNLDKEWYCEAELARLKGISRQWLNRNRWALPLGGEGGKFFGGRLRWHRSDLKVWLEQEDVELWNLYSRLDMQRKIRKRNPHSR